MGIAGLLLAAGASRRLGTPKQLVSGADAVPLVTRAAQQLVDAGCDPVLVVLGAEADAIAAAVADLPVRCVVNVHWDRGMGTSIAAGVSALTSAHESASAAAPPAESEAVLIMACDMPAVTVDHLASLIANRAHGQRVASMYAREDGTMVRGIPALLPRGDWAWLQALTGDHGARELLRRDDTRTVFLANGALDLDTAADIDRWREMGAGWQVTPPMHFPDTHES